MMIMNARMYSVSPRVEAIWQQLLEHVTAEAGVPLAYETYPLRSRSRHYGRPDLGAFMCGYPVAL
jgi:hypothetical protein